MIKKNKWNVFNINRNLKLIVIKILNIYYHCDDWLTKIKNNNNINNWHLIYKNFITKINYNEYNFFLFTIYAFGPRKFLPPCYIINTDKTLSALFKF